jgi:glycosyltransferase involved in cell wall biosynthesis
MISANFQCFRDSIAWRVVRKLRGFAREIQGEILVGNSPENMLVTLRPERNSRGRVLFSYIIDAFLLPSGTPIPKSHTNFWQSWQMAQTFVQLGYEVDVIHWTNHHFIPKGNYTILVDVRRNLERLAPLLNQDCVKIMHIDTAHILFHNAAEANRLLALQKRRGVTLNPRRFEMPNQGIEHADYGTATGNDFVVGTFAYAKKKIFKLPSPCGVTLDWLNRDWSQCRKKFLWFSSSGLVHKGLDLALEAFREMPECHLTVCAPLEKEKAFVRAYYRELYETSNIQTIGWVDVESENFKKIASSCGAALHLSCSEGGAPSVKTCMHAGLVPVVSYESGIDVHDYGYSLKDCSIDNIKLVISNIAQLPPDEVEGKARAAWAYARQNYTRENFSKEYPRVIVEILSEVQSKTI